MMKKTGGRKNLVGLSLITSFLSRLRFFLATFSLVAFNRFQNWFYPHPLRALTPLPYPQLTRGKGVQTILYSLVRGGIFIRNFILKYYYNMESITVFEMEQHFFAEASLNVPEFTISVYRSSCNLFVFSTSFSLLCFIFLFNRIPKAGWKAKK